MTRSTAIRVLIADDHAVVREGVRHVLASEHGFDVVGEASNGDDAVSLAESLTPDVVVLDLSMPGTSGLDAARLIRARAPQSRVLVLSIHDHAEYVQQSAGAGALGYLRKDSSPAQLRAAIRAVHAGERAFGASVIAPSPAALLTARERSVLAAIASGETSKETATRLGISVRTVEAHRDSLARKLKLRGAAALTRFAMENGLVP
jgi:two-component system nitrate/nitrite response regulator NarL